MRRFLLILVYEWFLFPLFCCLMSIASCGYISFEQMLKDLRYMLAETQGSAKELDEIEQELADKLARREITRFSFDIDMTRVRRSREDIRCCLRSLYRQRTIALGKLRELEKGA